MLARSETLELDDILVGGRPRRQGEPDSLQDVLDQQTERKIREVLGEVGGKRVDAAELLGIDRTTLYRLMKKDDID